MEKLYTLNEAAQILRVSERTIRRYLKDRRFQTKRVGKKHLVSEGALKGLLEGGGSSGEDSPLRGEPPRARAKAEEFLRRLHNGLTATIQGPRDLADNHDYYLYGFKKEED